jgi:plasmid stabilization system protein ParE
MNVRFVLAPQAALDLVEIWRYIKEQTSLTIADRVESAIREKIEGFDRRRCKILSCLL